MEFDGFEVKPGGLSYLEYINITFMSLIRIKGEVSREKN